MYKIKSKEDGGKLSIIISGRIDSANAAEAEAEIRKISDGYSGKVVIDAADLEYISSAGLRVILRLRKDHPDTSIINCNSEVYEIFDMTGFTEMMDIAKAYRIISVDGCEVIGEGANGIVYRIDPDTIVKLYKNPDALEEIHNERELARKAFVMGIPTAIPYDVVQVGDCYGSVFELLNATSFAKLLAKHPEDTVKLAKESVDILKAMHSTNLTPGELPDKKAEAIVWAEFCKPYLPEEIGDRLVRLVSEIPERHNMLHGDFHVKNIMRQNDENLLIDMDTLAMGHPVFEFSATFLAYVGFGCIDHESTTRFLGVPYQQMYTFWDATLSSYFGTEDKDALKEIENKAAVIGYARLLRRTIRRENNPELVEYCKKTLTELVPVIDNLYF